MKRKKGQQGFNQLMYKGMPVIMREDMPHDKGVFIDEEKSRVRLLDWKTGKLSEDMSYQEFEEWINNNKK